MEWKFYGYPVNGALIKQKKMLWSLSMRNTGLEEAQAGIKIARRNINNLRYANDTTLMAESGEELKSFLMRVKEKSEKVSLKLSIKKIRSWHPVPSLHGK